jgi:hypothetical protein
MIATAITLAAEITKNCPRVAISSIIATVEAREARMKVRRPAA